MLESLLIKYPSLVVKLTIVKASSQLEIVSEGEMKPAALLTNKSYKMLLTKDSLSS